MTYEEARARATQLNALHHVKRQEEQVQKILREQADEQRRHSSAMPPVFASEFEQRFIRKRDSQTEQGIRSTSRSYIRWRAAQRMIAAVGIDPSEWFYHVDKIYDYFHQQKMSLKYLQSILGIANLWGFYFCRKLGRPFLPVPAPRGYERQRLFTANNEKVKGVARASKPITPENLSEVKSNLNQNNFDWIFLSVWFGLRPKEVDSMHSRDMWRIEILPTGRQILWVFQTKIIALPPEDRWKPIPIIFREQEDGLNLIKSDKYRRPLMKTMRRHFGKGVTLYGGRKGFSDLMLSKKQTFENISVWMGHSSLQRTWRSYKERRRFHLEGF